MTTLNQILIEKLEDSRSIDLWKMIAKEWLQQKQIDMTNSVEKVCRHWSTIPTQFIFNELLEELE